MRVLLAVDGSPSSLRDAALIGRWASACRMHEVTVVHVVPPPAELVVPAAVGMPPQVDVPVDVMVENTAAAVFEQAIAAIDNAAVRVNTEALVGQPAEEIVRLARTGGYDMIAIGCRGLSPLKEILLGSISDQVIRHASCPVLVIK